MRRRRGRPAAGEDLAERLKHIRCTALLLSGACSARELARMHRVHWRTVYNWRDLALGYADEEAAGLREMPGGNWGINSRISAAR